MSVHSVDMPSDCGIEGVREGIVEYLGEVAVLEFGVQIFYDFLDRGRCELATVRMWAL